jgi:hypothetical protein
MLEAMPETVLEAMPERELHEGVTIAANTGSGTTVGRGGDQDGAQIEHAHPARPRRGCHQSSAGSPSSGTPMELAAAIRHRLRAK